MFGIIPSWGQGLRIEALHCSREPLLVTACSRQSALDINWVAVTVIRKPDYVHYSHIMVTWLKFLSSKPVNSYLLHVINLELLVSMSVTV